MSEQGFPCSRQTHGFAAWARPPRVAANLEPTDRICQTEAVCLRLRARSSLPCRWRTRDRLRGRLKSMSLSVAEVAKVAVLARLRVNPGELETFTGQLNTIVDYVAQLQELDTTGVEPLAHGIEVRDRKSTRLN